MPTPTKRTRTTSENDASSSRSSHTRRPSATSTSSTSSSRTSTDPATPTRPILTRSAATQLPPPTPPSHITRSSSLFIAPTGRGGPSTSSSFAPPPSATLAGSSGSSGRVGTLTRTQSQPAIPSPQSLKAAVAGAGGAGDHGKDEGPDEFGTIRGSRRLGKGKENIPPKKDEDLAGSSRKRMRVGSQSGAVGRRRSGSVSSMRSDTGRHTSLCPTSSSSSFSFRSRMSSPSPSQATSQSFDSVTSVDPLDVLTRQDDTDLDETPTRARSTSRRIQTLPTPPPSSPIIQATAQRLSLVRMQSDLRRSSPFEDDRKANPYKYLKSFLRLSAAPIDGSMVVGRDDEKAALNNYLDAQGQDVGMYVSGPPGTGKTATTTALGREMRAIGWQVAEVGCMGLKVADMWKRLGEELGCGKTEKDVQAYLEQANTQTLIILDEIDSLLPAPPASPPPATSHLLSRIFSLPLSSTSTVKLVAISNTLDLTLRANLVLPDNAQPVVLPFKAYVGADMAAIVGERIAAASVGRADAETVKVDLKAIELLTKKVENQNGDLRMCLGVLTSAVSLAETEWNKKGSPEGALIKVNLQHTIKAFNSHTNQLKASAGSSVGGVTSESGRKIKSVPLQGKMVLVSILLFMTRIQAGMPGCPSVAGGMPTPPSTPTKGPSSERLDTTNLYATYSHLLSQAASPFPPATESDYRDLLSNLEVLGLISISGAGSSGMSRTSSSSSGRGKGAPKIELCVREDEIKAGLGLAEGGGRGLAEDEVARVWEREEGRVRRVVDKVKTKEARVDEGMAMDF